MNCGEVQERLADEGQQAIENPAIEAHLQGCPACRRVHERLAQVDEILAELEPVEPSANVIERTHVRLTAWGRRGSEPHRVAGCAWRLPWVFLWCSCWPAWCCSRYASW